MRTKRMFHEIKYFPKFSDVIPKTAPETQDQIFASFKAATSSSELLRISSYQKSFESPHLVQAFKSLFVLQRNKK